VLAGDDALVEETQERLVKIEQTHVAQRLDEEARVEEVHHGVVRRRRCRYPPHPFFR